MSRSDRGVAEPTPPAFQATSPAGRGGTAQCYFSVRQSTCALRLPSESQSWPS